MDARARETSRRWRFARSVESLESRAGRGAPALGACALWGPGRTCLLSFKQFCVSILSKYVKSQTPLGPLLSPPEPHSRATHTSANVGREARGGNWNCAGHTHRRGATRDRPHSTHAQTARAPRVHASTSPVSDSAQHQPATAQVRARDGIAARASRAA